MKMRISWPKLLLLVVMSVFGLWASSMVVTIYYMLKLSLSACGTVKLLKDRLRYQLSRHFHRLWRLHGYELGRILILLGGTGLALTIGFSISPIVGALFWYLIVAYLVSSIAFCLGFVFVLTVFP
jgi:hypothetical protein